MCAYSFYSFLDARIHFIQPFLSILLVVWLHTHHTSMIHLKVTATARLPPALSPVTTTCSAVEPRYNAFSSALRTLVGSVCSVKIVTQMDITLNENNRLIRRNSSKRCTSQFQTKKAVWIILLHYGSIKVLLNSNLSQNASTRHKHKSIHPSLPDRATLERESNPQTRWARQCLWSTTSSRPDSACISLVPAMNPRLNSANSKRKKSDGNYSTSKSLFIEITSWLREELATKPPPWKWTIRQLEAGAGRDIVTTDERVYSSWTERWNQNQRIEHIYTDR